MALDTGTGRKIAVILFNDIQKTRRIFLEFKKSTERSTQKSTENVRTVQLTYSVISKNRIILKYLYTDKVS